MVKVGMWRRLSRSATSRLMYSDPLSTWKAWTVKGKAEMRSFERTGIMKCRVMRRDGSKVLELCDFVDDVDDVGALAATRIAEVDGVNAQKAGPAVRPRGLRRWPSRWVAGRPVPVGQGPGGVQERA